MPRSLSSSVIGKAFSDDRAAVVGDFLGTCDSMMSGFESLYDGTAASSSDSDSVTRDEVENVPTWENWINMDQPFDQ